MRKAMVQDLKTKLEHGKTMVKPWQNHGKTRSQGRFSGARGEDQSSEAAVLPGHPLLARRPGAHVRGLFGAGLRLRKGRWRAGRAPKRLVCSPKRTYFST